MEGCADLRCLITLPCLLEVGVTVLRSTTVFDAQAAFTGRQLAGQAGGRYEARVPPRANAEK